MSGFDRLHPAIQHHIVNSLGWPGLRPLQEATIEPVLNGEHAILLAPTAGGKTEAASFPIFSRMLSENWQGLSVLYICPIKALLNNLEERLSYYGHLLGRRVGVWHGDISTSVKNKILADPPDLLLTTPESIEVMLVSNRMDHRHLFEGLRAVIIDEVHAFAGDDRGWHLLSVLERLSFLTGRELQRLGLSATVGNPETLCDWLAGHCPSPRGVINPPAPNNVVPEIQVDWVGSVRNAAVVISRLHRGEKRLVFVDSRSRVEELAVELRNLSVTTYVSHSCLSLEERRMAEEAFAQGSDCVIVATSTLELGIDVGDLDRVIQIDAPFTVSSYLQRIGRTGRRAGSSRNCLFLVTKEDAFLRAIALLRLWEAGYVEPIEPPPLPLHIYCQQVMALVLQEKGIAEVDLPKWIGQMPGFTQLSESDRSSLVSYMLERSILHSDSGIIGIGDAGDRIFGQKNFLELFSVFTSPPMVKVFNGKQELGEVHQLTFATKEDGPTCLTLGGKSWITKYVDWARKKAFVEPTDIKGRSQWLSMGQPLQFAMCQSIQRVLASDDAYSWLSNRAAELLESLKQEFDWVEDGKTLITYTEDNVTWWTFGGRLFNSTASHLFASESDQVKSDNLAVEFIGVIDRDNLIKRIRGFLQESFDQLPAILDERFVEELKFSECLSEELAAKELSCRFDVKKIFDSLAGKELQTIKIEN